MKKLFHGPVLALGVCSLGFAQEVPGWINGGLGSTPEIGQAGGAAVQGYVEGQPPPPPPVAGEGVSGEPAQAGNEADAITPEIQALADGLLNDPIRIFNWVRENIEFAHYYGLRKGAALTLLEGSGNDADTSALLIALFRASGITARYRSGYSAAPLSTANAQDLSHWLGIDPVESLLAGFLFSRGTPDTHVLSIGGGNYGWKRIWVEADIGAVGVWFDPSFKTYNRVTGVDMTAAAGYNRSSLLTSAGGTVIGEGISGMSEANLANHLRDRTTALVNHIKSNLPSESPRKITGGYEKAALSSSSFPLGYVSGAGFDIESWESIPTSLFTTIRLQLGSVDRTMKFAELQGRRLSLVFTTNGAGQFYVDDTLLLGEVTGGAGSVNMTVTIDHPGGTFLDQNDAAAPKPYQRTGKYALLYGCDVSQRWLRARQDKLEDYRASGLADDSREVKTETLNVMGLTWMLQTQLASRMLADTADVANTFHHRFGRMADEYNATTGQGGYYVDVWMQASGYVVRRVGQDFLPVFTVDQFMASAIEHGIIAQMQGGAEAASTVKLASVANTGGKKLFLATSANWSAIQLQLTPGSYSGSDLTKIQTAISGGSTVLLPEAGNLAVQQWQGAGYVIWKNTGSTSTVEMLISGGYAGGYSGYMAPAYTAPVFQQQQSSAPRVNVAPATHFITTGADPIDMATGQFTYDATDLVLGDGVAPRGITFSRHYHGSRRKRDDAGLGPGWNHNLNVTATKRSDVEGALGQGTPQGCAALAVAVYAVWDVFKNRSGVKDWATSLLIAKWAVDRLQENAVAVALGDRILEFHLQPDGAYTAPPGSTLSLAKDGGGNFVLTERHGNTYAFNAQGKLATVTDLWGRAQTFSYSNGKVTQVTDCYGRTLTLGYNGSGMLTTVSDSTQRSVSFTPTFEGDMLFLVTDAEGKNSTYHHDASRRLIELRDHFGSTLVKNVTFDTQDRITLQHSQGDAAKPWKLYYAPGQTIEEDPAGGRITHHFDERHRLIGRTDALGRKSTVIYDGQDHAVKQTSPLGNTMEAAYDANQNLLQSKDALLNPASFLYDAQHRVTQATDRNDKPTLFENYNAFHQPQKVTDASGVITERTFNDSGGGAGMVATLTVGGQLKASYTYASLGELYRVTYPGGAYEERTYDNRGNVASIRNPRGFVSSFTHNKRRQLLTTTAPGSQAGDPASVGQQTYNDNGDPDTFTNPRGHPTSQFHSVLGKLLTTTLPGGATISNHYDSRDWVDEVTDPTGRKSTQVLDLAGQRTQVKDALQNKIATAYDADGRAWSVSDPLNHAMQTQFTARGEPEATIFADDTPANEDYIFRYFDNEGRLVGMDNRRVYQWQFGYDFAGRATITQSPMLRQWSRAYDTQGRLTDLIEPSGQRTVLAYDARNRVTTRTHKNAGGVVASSVSYAHDDNGNVLTATEGANVLIRTCDQRDRVFSYTNAQGETIGYRYDANGNLTQLIYPGSKTVTYAYDNRDRLQSITDWSNRPTSIEWDAASRPLKVTRPNGTYRAWTYDSAGRVTQIEERKSNKRAVCLVKMELDAAGRITKKLNLPLSQAAALPTFNAGHNPDNQVNGFTYDPDGNLLLCLAVPEGGQPYAFDYHTATWDTRNRLASLESGVGFQPSFTTTYTYDSESNRTHKTVNGQTTRYTVNPHGLSGMSETLIQHQPDGSKRYYIWGGPAGLLYEVQTNTSGTETGIRCYHGDQVGSTMALTDGAGQVTGRLEYSAYGMIAYREGNTDTLFLFNGAFGVVTDAESGLVSMRARYYHPFLGRFISEDSTGFDGGMNWYAFAADNPISALDPNGANPMVIGGLVLWWLFGNADTANAPNLGDAITGGNGAIGIARDGAIGAALTPVVGKVVQVGAAGVSKVVGFGGNVAGSSAAPNLVHLTSQAAGTAIQRSQTLVGNNFAGPAINAGLAPSFATSIRTGLSLTRQQVAVPIPQAAEAAFSKVVPIGLLTGVQAAAGTQYTANGILNLATGAFTRTGANLSQAAIYATDAAIDAAAAALTYSRFLSH